MSHSTASRIERALKSLSYESAKSIFAVSNTPLYLLRRLQTDSLTLEIAERLTGEEILNVIRSSIKKRPQTLEAMILPYALLTSLGLKMDVRSLRKASRISPKHHHWYKYIASSLLDRTVPTTSRKIDLSATNISLSRLSIDNGSASEPALDHSPA